VESVLDLMFLVIAIGVPLLLFEGAALLWGVDSRDTITDDHRR
jgi:nitrogen fixation-related uncharacterized protein